MNANLIQTLSVVAQIAAVAGIFLLYQQIELSRKATQCQLINDLEKEFSSHNVVFANLKPGGSWFGSAHLSREEIAELENLASFCEKLGHFRSSHILSWKTLDLMFRNRFFLIMHNTNVLTHVIKPCVSDWETALSLEKEWRKRLPKADPRREVPKKLLELEKRSTTC